jgi:hypothetical protein
MRTHYRLSSTPSSRYWLRCSTYLLRHNSLHDSLPLRPERLLLGWSYLCSFLLSHGELGGRDDERVVGSYPAYLPGQGNPYLCRAACCRCGRNTALFSLVYALCCKGCATLVYNWLQVLQLLLTSCSLRSNSLLQFMSPGLSQIAASLNL